MRRYRCVIVDDEPEVIKRLKNLLEKVSSVEVVASEGTAAGAIEQVVELRPDIVFMDIEMPCMNGFDVIAAIRSRFCCPKFIIVTAFNQYAIKAIKAAAFDFLLKPVDIGELTETIRRFEETQIGSATDIGHSGFDCLSRREKEIAGFLVKGMSSREIADKLFLSKHTVDTHRRNILHKLKLSSTLELICQGE